MKTKINRKFIILLIILAIVAGISTFLIIKNKKKCPHKPCPDKFLELPYVDPVAFPFQGGGSMSVTNFSALFSAVLKNQNSTVKDHLIGRNYVGGNSGGGWFTAILCGFKQNNSSEENSKGYPMDSIREMSWTDVLLFYNEKWLKPIRKHIHVSGQEYGGYATDENGFPVEGKSPILVGPFEVILDKLSDPDTTKDDVYELIIGDLLNSKDKINKEDFEIIVHRHGRSAFIQNLIDFIRYLLNFLNYLVNNSMMCIAQDFFFFPLVDAMRRTRINEIEMMTEIGKMTKGGITMSMTGTALYSNYLRYGYPGEPRFKDFFTEQPRYPSYSKPIQSFRDPMLRYQWNNPNVDKKLENPESNQLEKNQTIKVLGGLLNQCYTYGSENGPDKEIPVHNFITNDTSNDTTNNITYEKLSFVDLCKVVDDVTVNFDGDNNISRDSTKNRRLIDTATLTGCGLGAFNTKKMVEGLPCDIITSFFKKFPCDKNGEGKEMTAISELARDIGTTIDKIICTLAVGLLSKFIYSNKVCVIDGNQNSKNSLGGISGKHWTELIMEKETIIKEDGTTLTTNAQQGILTENFEQNCTVDSQKAWSGIVSPSVFGNWKGNLNTLNADAKGRFIYCACDGGPLVSNSGMIPMLQGLQLVPTVGLAKGENPEIVYFADIQTPDAASQNNLEILLGVDLVEMFGIPNRPPQEVITPGLGTGGSGYYRRISVGGSSLPPGVSLNSSSPWVFGEKEPSLSERKTYLKERNMKNGKRMLWPADCLYTDYKDALGSDSEWKKLLHDKEVQKDLPKTPTLNDLFNKIDSIPTGVRIIRLEDIELRENQCMGVKEEGSVNITIVGTYSKLAPIPTPERGVRQLSNEFWTSIKLTAQLKSFNDNQDPRIGGYKWMDKLMPHTQGSRMKK